jgi:hypothetical protein
MEKIPTSRELFDTSHTIAARLIERSYYGHRAIEGLGEFIKNLIAKPSKGAKLNYRTGNIKTGLFPNVEFKNSQSESCTGNV